jgi:murein DD-endopeptidase MepM/ murein hydrolase activator NlpD
MSKTLVRPGQRLRRGTEIGKVGHTGKALGDHVHYEVRKNANAVNPYQFILEEETVAPASGRRP